MPLSIIVSIRYSTAGAPEGTEQSLGGIQAGNAAVAAGIGSEYLTAFEDITLTADQDLYGRLWARRFYIYLPLVLR